MTHTVLMGTLNPTHSLESNDDDDCSPETRVRVSDGNSQPKLLPCFRMSRILHLDTCKPLTPGQRIRAIEQGLWSGVKTRVFVVIS